MHAHPATTQLSCHPAQSDHYTVDKHNTAGSGAQSDHDTVDKHNTAGSGAQSDHDTVDKHNTADRSSLLLTLSGIHH